MPKRIGGRIYLHQNYMKVLGADMIHEVTFALEKAEEVLGSFDWNTLRIKPNAVGGADEVAFQFSPDFDSADEPEVTQTVTVRLDGSDWSIVNVHDHAGMIWHHKWMWVDKDYTGFSYAASKAHSAKWKPLVKKEELPKIGRKKFWESIKTRWDSSCNSK
jgi:hypothetical protein